MGMFEDGYGAVAGIQITCQRCGKKAFRKQKGYNHIDAAIENRHSLLDEFEPMPDDWKIKKDAGGWLCAECLEDYQKMVVSFIKEKKQCITKK